MENNKTNCDKVKHNSYSDAVIGMKKANDYFKKGKNKYPKLKNVYKCSICGFYHTTKQKN